MNTFKIAVPTHWSNMDHATKKQTLDNMRLGGSFAFQVAEAIEVADDGNAEKMVTAFAHLIDRFKPEAAIRHFDATCLQLSFIEVEGSHCDVYLQIACPKEVTVEQLKTNLHKAFQNLAAIGPWRGYSVHVREGIDAGEFIGIVRKTYYK